MIGMLIAPTNPKINIPIINRSVVWWNSLHQPASITLGKSAIDPAYLWPLMFASLGFSLIFGGVVLARMRAILADQQAEARLRRKAMAISAGMAGPSRQNSGVATDA